MPRKNVLASIKETAFDCPYCGAFTSQTWFTVHAAGLSGERKTPVIFDNEVIKRILSSKGIEPEIREKFLPSFQKMANGQILLEQDKDGQWVHNNVENLWLSKCYNCDNIGVWVHDKLVFPPERYGPSSNIDLPKDVLRDFEEARIILNLSPRGAAALLRLSIQKLCVFLGEKGKDINDDIASLVAKGLNPLVQKSLDVVRVIGNEAVHPGVINLKDDRDTATKLFDLVNIIADQMITQPKNVNKMYESLPDTKKEAIVKRDGKGVEKPSDES